MLSGLVPASHRQAGIFHPGPDERLQKLTGLMDRVNSRYGRDRLRLTGAGFDPSWHHKQQFMSTRYTTEWQEVLVVR